MGVFLGVANFFIFFFWGGGCLKFLIIFGGER